MENELRIKCLTMTIKHIKEGYYLKWFAEENIKYFSELLKLNDLDKYKHNIIIDHIKTYEDRINEILFDIKECEDKQLMLRIMMSQEDINKAIRNSLE